MFLRLGNSLTMGTTVFVLRGLYLMLFTCSAVKSSVSEFELVITHTNDVHARFEEIDKYGGKCNQKAREKFECFGGVARRMTKLKELRRQYSSNLLLLDAGDQFQGTLWFYVYSGKAAAHFMNLLQYDAMALGNHEFDNGVDGLEQFLHNVSFPVLSANIDSSKEKRINGKFHKSQVFTFNGEKIGVIGFTSLETPVLSETGGLQFNAEVDSLQREVDRLEESGINKIIAVGHSGIKVDREIARAVNGVDVVIGGHTNTFLYTGPEPSTETAAGSYPTVIGQEGDGRALVVTDYAFGKYLGFLKVGFDGAGKVVTWSGNPILLNGSVEEDPAILAEINQWRQGIDGMANQTVGNSHVFLDGRSHVCRLEECNLGNLITDAMVMANLRHADETRWTNVSLAITNSGGIRAPLNQGPVTTEDILNVMPFRNTIDIIEIKGDNLVQVFERSVSQYDKELINGAFLQASGVQVTYDLNRPSGSRVTGLLLRCSNCLVPRLEPVDANKIYQVLIPFYLANGGDGYGIIPESLIRHHIVGDLDTDVLLEYITKFSPLVHGVEGRIRFTANDGCTSDSNRLSSTNPSNIIHIVTMLLIIYMFVNLCS